MEYQASCVKYNAGQFLQTLFAQNVARGALGPRLMSFSKQFEPFMRPPFEIYWEYNIPPLPPQMYTHTFNNNLYTQCVFGRVEINASQ